jgi:hypothetical protein
MASGLSVYLPPECLVTPNGMAGNGKNQPDLITELRSAYALGQTPMIFNAMLPKSLAEFSPEEQDLFQHYAHLYKSFIRPLLDSCRIFHHAPVNATDGVESGDWFAMEFVSPNQAKAWATIVRLRNGAGSFLFRPRGLNPRRTYRVTFDNSGESKTLAGEILAKQGLTVCTLQKTSSELLLFEALARGR